MSFSSRLVVDLEAILQNHTLISRHLPPDSQIMPIIKGNGYGMGLIPMAHFFQSINAPILGVSLMSEALQIRAEGISIPIFCISCMKNDYKLAAKNQIQIGLNSFEELDYIESEMLVENSSLMIHLNVDTGMHRLGIEVSQVEECLRRIQTHPHLHLEGIMSHFSATLPQFRDYTHDQDKKFSDVCSLCDNPPRWIHMANSRSLFFYPKAQGNLVRVGRFYLGLSTNLPINLTPSVSLYTNVVSTHHINIGEHIGYDGWYIEQTKRRKIAVLSIGYCDGLHIAYSGKGFAFYKGYQLPYLGKICMDYMMVDITEVPHVDIGDEVEIFGPNLSAAQVANWTIVNYLDFICCLGPRVKRLYKNVNKIREIDPSVHYIFETTNEQDYEKNRLRLSKTLGAF